MKNLMRVMAVVGVTALMTACSVEAPAVVKRRMPHLMQGFMRVS